jgi:hypothetical protein
MCPAICDFVIIFAIVAFLPYEGACGLRTGATESRSALAGSGYSNITRDFKGISEQGTDFVPVWRG